MLLPTRQPHSLIHPFDNSGVGGYLTTSQLRVGAEAQEHEVLQSHLSLRKKPQCSHGLLLLDGPGNHLWQTVTQ